MRWLPAVALLLAAPPARAADPVAITKGDGVLEFKVGDTVAARYFIGDRVAKPYLWPLLSPNGTPVTRGWPMETGKPGGTTDHVHQKSAWFCHGDVIPEGIELKIKTAEKGGQGVDFWSEAKDKNGVTRYGRIKCVFASVSKSLSPSQAVVETKNEWITPDGVKILDETRAIHFHNLDAGRLFVFDIDLHASVCPITFGDTKEGSFGVRVSDAIREANKSGDGKLTNAAGKTGEKAVWGQLADWCDYSGTIDGKVAGIAVFDDPRNPSRAAWHARGYGLMAANPFGRERSGFPARKGQTDLVKIAKGDHLKLRYAIYAHDGNVEKSRVAEAYEVFKKMPRTP